MDTEGFHTAATLNYRRENKGLAYAMKAKELIYNIATGCR